MGSAGVREPGADLLDRERLLALDHGQPILVAEAPSGYGKTVFARSWKRHAPAGTRTLWVSLDPAAHDPTVFLERLAAAVAGSAIPAGGATLDDEAGRAECFARIASDLADEPQAIRLVLDDVHHLAGSSSRSYLQRLLQGATSRLRILLTLQPVELDVGLGALAAQNKVCWLSAGVLALTDAEVRAYALGRGQSLAPQQVECLTQATQGWPALVQLALAVSLERGPLMLGSIAGLGPVREYIYERFLTRLNPGERELLWNLSCVGAAPLRLLDALSTPPHQPQTDLQRLLALGIVQPEEPAVEPTVRLHPLVRDSASRVLAVDRPQARGPLLLAAARWYWAEGQGVAAVRALFEAGTEYLPQARTWLIELADPLIFRQGHHQTLLDLVARWEQLAGRIDAELNCMAVWALIFQRRFALAENRLQGEGGAAADPALVDEESLQRGTMAALRNDFEAGGRLAHEWLQRKARALSFHSGAAWTVYAFGLKCNGAVGAAQAALRHAHASFSRAQSGYGTVWAYIVGALAQIRIGRHRDALAEVERGLTLCGDTPGFGGQRAMLRAVEAFVRYERNELSRVREVLDEAMPLLPEQGIVDTLVLGFTAAARMRAATGDLGSALDILSEGERSGFERDFRKLSVSLRAERALILARTGATGQARQLSDLGPIAGEALPATGLVRDRMGRLHARLAIAEGEPARALQMLAPLQAHARSAGQQYKLCELLVLAALAEDILDHEARAFAMLREALELGRSECYLRLFIDEGAELHNLLRRWLKAVGAQQANRSEAAWAEVILATLNNLQADRRSPGDAPYEALNRRERQFLALLDEGLSNAEIAARCFLVEGTVKWHLHNLYTKFGVRSRTAVLRAARAHGVLDT